MGQGRVCARVLWHVALSQPAGPPPSVLLPAFRGLILTVLFTVPLPGLGTAAVTHRLPSMRDFT
jgi:hypothetical protein